MKKLLFLCMVLIGLVSCNPPVAKLPFTVIDVQITGPYEYYYLISDVNENSSWIGPFSSEKYQIGDVIGIKQTKYYDGEGNIIPDTIVDLMVKAYFTDIDSANEKILINYINKK